MALTLTELCDEFRNETAHADQVARFALAIWDAVSPVFALKASERRLMKATALLHDIGYSSCPQDHHGASHAIILKIGIAGFTESQVRIIAGAALLHKRKFAPELESPFFSDPAVAEPAMRLAAILRIADGLDHSHCQNSSIVNLQAEGDRVVCVVSSPGYDGNIPKARMNADLWLRVFKIPFAIEEAAAGEPLPKFSGILGPDDKLADAIRKLLFLHFRTLSEQFDGMVDGKSEEFLHDARIAMRRYRSVLLLFGTFLPQWTRLLDRRLALLGRKLSEFRDGDVWLAFLAKLKKSASFRSDREFAGFISRETELEHQRHTALVAILNGKSYGNTTKEMIYLPRAELAQLDKSLGDLLAAPVAGRMLSATFYDILSRRGVKKATDPETAHRLRRRCRRLRYWAEFFTPVLGNAAGDLAVLMKELADILGDLHDTDCFMARMKEDKSPVAAKITSALASKRQRELADFKQAWKRLRSPEIIDGVKSLASAGAGIPELTVVRHASAIDGPDDRKRPLSDTGAREAKRVGRVLKLLDGSPLPIFTSPLVRAVSTARGIAEALSPAPAISRLNSLSPEAPLDKLLARAAAPGTSMLLVGHLPQLDLFVDALLADAGKQKQQLAKGSVCRIVFPEGRVAAGKGVLAWYFTQERLKRIEKRLGSGA